MTASAVGNALDMPGAGDGSICRCCIGDKAWKSQQVLRKLA